MARFDDWKIGTQTEKGIVTRIFHKKTECFIIYEVNDAGWFLFDSVGDIGKGFSSVQLEWAETVDLLRSEKHRSRYIGTMAGALKECLLGDASASKDKLKRIRISIIDYRTTLGRIEYLAGALITALLLVIAVLVTSSFKANTQIVPNVILFGVLGGILSVTLGLKSVAIDMGGERVVHVALGGTRVIISAISSLIIYVLIKGNFLLGVVNTSNDYVFYALGALSGFSESFVPSLLRKVDTGIAVEKEKTARKSKSTEAVTANQ